MREPDGRTDVVVIGAPPGSPTGSDAATVEPSRRWKPELRRRALIAVVVLWAVVITAVVFLRGDREPQAPAAARPPSPSASGAPLTVSEVYRTLLPSVVRIESSGGSAQPTSMAESSTGTGVVVNADGTILTALHVVDGATTIQLRYADGTESAAQLADSDARRDVATLRPARLPETLVPAVLGGGLQVGDPVVAIGNPLGLTASTSSGVVSGLDRSMARENAEDIPGLIQFDAAVNPGSSGGPLVNQQGQVAGIVIALANPTSAGTFIGIGFAVPIGAALSGGAGDGRAPPL